MAEFADRIFHDPRLVVVEANRLVQLMVIGAGLSGILLIG